MIYTSNFANLNNLKMEDCLSIAIGTPKWYEGKILRELQPTWELVLNHKHGNISDNNYTEIYKDTILSKLNPEELIKKIDGKILLCWCGKDKFCHRYIVSDWLNEYKENICKEL